MNQQMKRILWLCFMTCLLTTGFSQEEKKEKSDTLRIGGMIILRKPGSNEEERQHNQEKTLRISKRKISPQNVSTNWWIVDLGYSNYNDKTDYASAAAQAFAPGSTDDWLDLRAGKSRNVNIWFFMQRLNIIQHVVNLKYGTGLELNNYHFDDERIRFQKNPTLITMDNSLKDARKNKLAADYLTIPIMLNINFTPDRRNGFGISGGLSAGYLYSARQKTKVGDDKTKLRNDFDLNRWKLAYVGELLLGPVKLYGSYALNNMWEKGLNQTPYTFGFRLSNW